MVTDKPKILIVDDDRRMAKTIQDILKVKNYEAECAFSGPDALKKIKKTSFSCILTDVKMPEMDGITFYRAVKKIDPYLPVILMTAYYTDALIEKGLKEGALVSLTKPLDINLLLQLFSSLHRQCSIVIVDDDLNFSGTLSAILQKRGFQVIQVPDPHNLTEKIKPDSQIILLDMKLNDISGLDILKKIRKAYLQLPIILVTGYREKMKAAIDAALKIDAYTFLYKPFQIEKLIELLTKIHHQQLKKTLNHFVR